MEEDEDLAVTARNSKGASDPVLLRDLVFRDAEKRAGEGNSLFLIVITDFYVSLRPIFNNEVLMALSSYFR